MLDRTTGLLLAAAGALLVALLLVAGVDIQRAAKSGPRWRRRLVAAGIMLLSALGVTACDPNPQVTCYVTVVGGSTSQGLNAAQLRNRAGNLYDAAIRNDLRADSLAVVSANINAEMDSLIAAASDTERAALKPDLALTLWFLDEARAMAVVSGKSLLEQDQRWSRLTFLMQEARLAGSGRMGPYPFDRATQERLQRDLVAGDETLTALERDGLLHAAEKALLAQELQHLYALVSEKRPVEMQMATCYEPMMYLPGRDGLARLTARIDWLEKAAAAQTLHPEALRAALATIESDCALLADANGRGQMTPDEIKQAGALTARTNKALAALAGR